MPIFTSDLTSSGIIYADTITTNSNEDLTLNPAGTGRVVVGSELVTNKISSDDSTQVEIQDGLMVGGDITMPDNQFIRFGAIGDLYIGHNANQGKSAITEIGQGSLDLQSSGGGVNIKNLGSNYAAKFDPAGTTELYASGDKKFETTATGVKVTGDAEVQGSVIADTITTSGSNSDINISANGTGAVVVESLQIQGNQITATDSTQIAFGQQQLTDVADPTQASDAATKSYVDTQVSGIESGVSAGFAIAMSIAL